MTHDSNDKPLISVIMVAYNAAEYIEAAIDSVLKQTYQNFEFLIGDDGSTDATQTIVERYNDPRIRKFSNAKNMGSLRMRNWLLKEVRGEFIAFQDADDVSMRHRLEYQMEQLINNPETGICGTWYDLVDEDGHLLHSMTPPTEHGPIRKAFTSSVPICFPTSVIRKNVIDEIGLIRDYFRDLGNYDYDWMFLIIERYKGTNIGKSLYRKRVIYNSNQANVVNPRKRFGWKIVRFLASERENKGKDSLMTDGKDLENFIEDQERLYRRDPSLYFRELAENYFSVRARNLARSYAWKAIKAKPGKTMNYRTLLYILRH